ncbi:MAG: exodeoxyribonuclease VII large subunit, partial [Erysipelotrichaceae bacterium]|nr:exodeoxyribonuclease VII large subunit [Erysipelotrichaceae bacterium]
MSQAWTVSALNGYLKSVIENDGYLSHVILEGEISNFTAHVSGHWYFTVKDDASRISGVMWASAARSNRYFPKDGAKVRVTGRVSVYLPNGQYQIYATSIQEAGIGDLFLEFEKRKRKIAELGWADPSRKKPIPAYPM